MEDNNVYHGHLKFYNFYCNNLAMTRMDIISDIKYGIWRIPEKICMEHNIYILLKTRIGIKNLNMLPLTRRYGSEAENDNPIFVTPSDLYLGPDYLKDKYTLLGKCILESPHYDFMRAINDNMDITQTEYYSRIVAGKLDGRHRQRKRNKMFFHSKKQEAEVAIDNGIYAPVKIYKWKERYYIYDGKHRAALCALKNKNVKCILIKPIVGEDMSLVDKEIYRLMAENNQYSRHNKFVE